MSSVANTPKPSYYAVIFTSHRTVGDNGYGEMAVKMVELISRQSGFLGIESARQDVGISVSYWTDLDSIRKWKRNIEHQKAQKLGHEKRYSSFKTRISKVEFDSGFYNFLHLTGIPLRFIPSGEKYVSPRERVRVNQPKVAHERKNYISQYLRAN